jgi:isoquinoline 1-oxidoreductase subunit beta
MTIPRTSSSSTPALTRRRFVEGAAATTAAPVLGSLVVGFQLGSCAHAEPSNPATMVTSPPGAEVNAWVVINPDETIVVRIARSEMGQGTLTGLAQLVAEELECDWSKIRTEYPTPGKNLERNRVWGNFSTGGSRGIRESHEYVRKAGAAARMMLVQAAANRWNVPAAECTAAMCKVQHAASGRSATYGQLAVDAAKLEAPKDIALKDPKNWTIAGKPIARLDTAPKVDGSQIYGMDLVLPGMLLAAIKDCPVFGGKVKSFDAAAIAQRPGVKKVVPVGDSAVAVIADTWWRAKTALDALPIVWDEGPNAGATQAQSLALLREGLDAAQAGVGNSAGDAKAALAGAARVIEATYQHGHQNHATMETMNATAKVTLSAAGGPPPGRAQGGPAPSGGSERSERGGDVVERCEVWTPTQNGEAALAAAAEAAGLQPAQCEVYKLHLGGGFGRRGAVHDWVRQAVMIARQMPGVPVKLIWSREEDMLHGRYHPLTMARLRAGVDAQGKVTALQMRLSGQSILASVAPQNIRDGIDPVAFQGLNRPGPEASFGYGVPNLLIDHAIRNPPVPAGFWRGVNLNQNTFYVECFLDEVAHALKKDPLELRLELMGPFPKHKAVLEAAAKGAGWGTQAPAGVHRGLAQAMGFGSYVAACAEVSVQGGELKIHRIVAATDCGHAVNPKQIAMQVEGSFAYGLSTLWGECTLDKGRMQQANFDAYPVMRMAQMPKVETIVMPSGGFWGGVGEPTIAVALPAVLNAVFAATGKRVRTLPLRDQLKA